MLRIQYEQLKKQVLFTEKHYKLWLETKKMESENLSLIPPQKPNLHQLRIRKIRRNFLQANLPDSLKMMCKILIGPLKLIPWYFDAQSNHVVKIIVKGTA